MRLFTSNSKFEFAARVIVISFSIFMVINVWLRLRPAEINRGKDYRDNNIIRAQNFIYSRGKPDVVLLGSSMSVGLLPENVNGVHNLSIAAYSAMTGVEILRRSGRIPRLIVIEMNTIDAPESTTFVDKLFPPYRHRIIEALPVLRKKYQFFALVQIPLLSMAQDLRNRLRKDPKPATPSAPPAAGAPTAEFQKRLDFIFSKYWAVAPREKVIRGNLKRLRDHVRHFRAAGSRVIFLELPVHPKIGNSPRARLMDAMVKKEFPSPRNSWYSLADMPSAKTSDGVHADPATHFQVRRLLLKRIFSEFSL